MEALADVVVERPAGDPRDDVAEQRVGEVRVVPGGGGRQDLLGLREPLQQLLLAGELERLPDLARRLALKAGRVRQHPPQRRRPVRGLGEVLRERVVEVELALVPELHDGRRRERLRDRRDRVPRLRRRLDPALRVSVSERLRPDGLARAEDRAGDARQPAGRLRLEREAPEAFLRRGQGFPERPGSTRARGRCPRRRRPGASRRGASSGAPSSRARRPAARAARARRPG